MRGYGYGPGPGTGPDFGPHAFGPGAAGLAWLFLIGLLIVGVVVLVVMLTRQKATTSQAQTALGAGAAAMIVANPVDEALAVAAKRYAKGEIKKEEFEEIRTVLRTPLSG